MAVSGIRGRLHGHSHERRSPACAAVISQSGIACKCRRLVCGSALVPRAPALNESASGREWVPTSSTAWSWMPRGD